MVHADVRFEHSGYQLPADYQAKLARNLPILERMLAADPNDPVIHFDLGRTLAGMGKAREAIAHYQVFLRDMDRRQTIAGRVAHRQVALLLWQLRDVEAAAAAAVRGLGWYPDDAVLITSLANIYALHGKHDLARQGYERALALSSRPSVDFGIAADFPGQVRRAMASLPKTGTISITGGLVTAR